MRDKSLSGEDEQGILPLISRHCAVFDPCWDTYSQVVLHSNGYSRHCASPVNKKFTDCHHNTGA